MAKSKKTETVTAEQIVDSFLETLRLASLYDGGTVPVDVDEDEEVEEEDEEVELTREMVEEATASGIKALRELAIEVGVEETKKADILAAFDELLGDEEEDEEDEDEEVEDEDDDEEEDEDESDEWDRESLEEEDLKSLRAIAKEAGNSAADVKGLDQDALIDLILGEEDEDDDEDEENDEDEDVEEIDEDALKAMTQKDLIGLAKELEIKVPTAVKSQSAANKKKLVKMILDSGEDEE